MMNVLTILLDLPLKEEELPFFRGALIAEVGASNILFHDHTEEGLRYSYPLIQYKCLGGYAAVTAIESAIPQAGCLFFGDKDSFRLKIGRKYVVTSVADIHKQALDLAVTEQMNEYTITRWLPLNQENYKKYQEIDSLSERFSFLERLLVGNILSFAKGVGVFLDGDVKIKITDQLSTQTCRFKGVDMLSLSLRFKSNVTLPEFIGLGKGVSLGFGTVNRVKSEK